MKLNNLKLRTRTIGLRNKLGIIAIVCLLIFAAGVSATIRLKDPSGSTHGYWGDGSVITSDNGVDIKSWTPTGTNLQAAIWYLNSTGGIVKLPVGEIMVGATNITSMQDITIVGSGFDVTSVRFSGNNGFIFENVPTLQGRGGGIEHLQVTQYGAANGTAIKVVDILNFHIDRIHFYHVGTCIQMENQCYFSTISRCNIKYFNDYGIKIYGDATSGNNEIYISNCEFNPKSFEAKAAIYVNHSSGIHVSKSYAEAGASGPVVNWIELVNSSSLYLTDSTLGSLGSSIGKHFVYATGGSAFTSVNSNFGGAQWDWGFYIDNASLSLLKGSIYLSDGGIKVVNQTNSKTISLDDVTFGCITYPFEPVTSVMELSGENVSVINCFFRIKSTKYKPVIELNYLNNSIFMGNRFFYGDEIFNATKPVHNITIANNIIYKCHQTPINGTFIDSSIQNNKYVDCSLVTYSDDDDTFSKIFNSRGHIWHATAANIQLALNDLEDTGGTVYLPSKHFNISTALYIKGNNIDIVGSGNTTITCINGYNSGSPQKGLLILDSVHNVTVENIIFNGNNASVVNTVTLIVITGSSTIAIDKCVFEDSAFADILATPDSGNSDNILIIDCYLTRWSGNNDHASVRLSGVSESIVSITNSKWKDCLSHSDTPCIRQQSNGMVNVESCVFEDVYIAMQMYNGYAKMSNCIVDGASNYYVDVHDGGINTISNCVFEGITTAIIGIRLLHLTDGTTTVKDCYIDGEGVATAGIEIDNHVNNCSIINNIIHSCGTGNNGGIVIEQGSSDVLIEGNEIYGCTNNGIYGVGTAQNRIQIINNRIHDNTQTGIRLETFDNCTFSGNSFGNYVRFDNGETSMITNNIFNNGYIACYNVDNCSFLENIITEAPDAYPIIFDASSKGNIIKNNNFIGSGCITDNGASNLDYANLGCYRTFPIVNMTASSISSGFAWFETSTNVLNIKNGANWIHPEIPLYNQALTPNLLENTSAYWYNTTGNWLYLVRDYGGTEYYVNMSTTY